jgi:hypothetical protein
METNKGAVILDEQTADDRKLDSVLRDWGYKESDIQRFLRHREPSVEPGLAASRKVTDQSASFPPAVSS